LESFTSRAKSINQLHPAGLVCYQPIYAMSGPANKTAVSDADVISMKALLELENEISGLGESIKAAWPWGFKIARFWH
jgi:hypothetical protein